MTGDYDHNGRLEANDLDLQAIAIAGGQHPYEYDLSGEGDVNYTDRLVWLEDLYRTHVGDADLNHEYSSADWVTVFVIGKYGRDELATWAEGDFNGDLRFDSWDLLAANQDGVYEDPYPGYEDPGLGNGQPLLPNGVIGDGQTSIVYHADTGELSVDLPSNGRLTTLEIESAVPIFWSPTPAELNGAFDVYTPSKLFKLDAASFGSTSFGPLAMQAGLSESFVLNELRVDGSLSPSSGLGPVDLVYLSTGSPVSNPPIANDDDVTVTFETPITIDVLANDFDPDPAGILDVTSVQIVAAPANGTVRVNSATGEVIYIHDPDWFVGDSFTYAVKDDAGALSNVATVDVAVDCGDLGQNRLLPSGVIGDGITSIVYDSDTGELAVDVPGNGLLSALEIRSDSGVFTGPTPPALSGSFDVYTPLKLFKLDANGWGSTSFGPVMQAGFSESFLLDDLLVDGAWVAGGVSCMEDLVYLPLTGDYDNSHKLDAGDLDLQAIAITGGQHPSTYDLNGDGLVDEYDRKEWLEDIYGTYFGDADLNHKFSSSDWAKVFAAGKYELDEWATWAEGDFNGDMRFDSDDLVPGHYEQGSYPGSRDPIFGNGESLLPNGVVGDGQMSIVYDADTGELSVDVPSNVLLTTLEIESALVPVFYGPTPAEISGQFDIYRPNKLFKLLPSSFGSTSFGPLAMQAGLSESFVLNELRVDGSLSPSSGLGPVDLVYVSTNSPVNNPPVAFDDMTTTASNTPVTIDVLANDLDPDPAGIVDATSVQIGVAPANGAVDVNPATGEVTYTPDLNFHGPDGFTYTVMDDEGAPSNVAAVTVTIPAPPPSVIDVRALFGSQSYSLMGNSPILPWINIMAIEIVFDTLVVIKRADLRLVGVSGGLYDGQLSGGHELPDVLITDTATFTLSDPIEADRLTLSLDGDDDSSDGNVGVSGGGAYLQGGDFSLELNVLPGDVYQEGTEQGIVNIVDTFNTRSRQFQSIGDPLYSVTYDVNGDGRIDIADTFEVRQRQFTSLPSTMALAVAAADEVFRNDTDWQSSETDP